MISKVIYENSLIFNGVIRDKSIMIDGNGDNAPRPLEYLLTTLAACTSMSIISILKKMQIQISSMNAEAEGIQSAEAPKVFEVINIKYSFFGKIETESIEKAISLTMEKYSPTAVMLIKSGVQLKYSYRIYE
jgi:putative redox protein